MGLRWKCNNLVLAFESLPPAHAVCLDPINPSTLSSHRSAASFYAISLLFSSESCCPCSVPLPSDARLVFQPCQTRFVFEAFKKKSNSNLVTLFDWFSLGAHACLHDVSRQLFRGSLYRGSGQNWPRHIRLVSNPDVLTSAMLTSVIFLCPHCTYMRWRWGHLRLQLIPALHLNTIIYKDGHDFPPLFRRGGGSFGT